MDREFDPLSLPICRSCIFKKNPNLKHDPWFDEPDRIQRKLLNIKSLDFDQNVIALARKHGKVSSTSVQIEQCNPLQSDRCVRPDLLAEHKAKLGFNPVLIEGLDVQLASRDEIESLRQSLPKEYSAYLYFLSYGEKPRAIVSNRISDVEFVTARNTSGGNANVFNHTIRQKIEKWKTQYRCSVLGASYDTLLIKFKRIRSKDELKVLLDEIARFCPDVRMSTDWRNEIGQRLQSGQLVSLWWD